MRAGWMCRHLIPNGHKQRFSLNSEFGPCGIVGYQQTSEPRRRVKTCLWSFTPRTFRTQAETSANLHDPLMWLHLTVSLRGIKEISPLLHRVSSHIMSAFTQCSAFQFVAWTATLKTCFRVEVALFSMHAQLHLICMLNRNSQNTWMQMSNKLQSRGKEVPCYRPPVVFGEKA